METSRNSKKKEASYVDQIVLDAEIPGCARFETEREIHFGSGRECQNGLTVLLQGENQRRNGSGAFENADAIAGAPLTLAAVVFVTFDVVDESVHFDRQLDGNGSDEPLQLRQDSFALPLGHVTGRSVESRGCLEHQFGIGSRTEGRLHQFAQRIDHQRHARVDRFLDGNGARLLVGNARKGPLDRLQQVIDGGRDHAEHGRRCVFVDGGEPVGIGGHRRIQIADGESHLLGQLQDDDGYRQWRHVELDEEGDERLDCGRIAALDVFAELLGPFQQIREGLATGIQLIRQDGQRSQQGQTAFSDDGIAVAARQQVIQHLLKLFQSFDQLVLQRQFGSGLAIQWREQAQQLARIMFARGLKQLVEAFQRARVHGRLPFTARSCSFAAGEHQGPAEDAAILDDAFRAQSFHLSVNAQEATVADGRFQHPEMQSVVGGQQVVDRSLFRRVVAQEGEQLGHVLKTERAHLESSFLDCRCGRVFVRSIFLFLFLAFAFDLAFAFAARFSERGFELDVQVVDLHQLLRPFLRTGRVAAQTQVHERHADRGHRLHFEDRIGRFGDLSQGEIIDAGRGHVFGDFSQHGQSLVDLIFTVSVDILREIIVQTTPGDYL